MDNQQATTRDELVRISSEIMQRIRERAGQQHRTIKATVEMLLERGLH